MGTRKPLVEIVGSAALVLGLAACGESGSGSASSGSGPDGGASRVLADAAVLPPCSDLRCLVNTSCADGGSTSLRGTVYDPAGKNPLYEAIVYVPTDDNAPLPALGSGTSSCSTSCNPYLTIGPVVVGTSTDVHGGFVLNGVPTGKSVPLVMQLGKWRREIHVETSDCTDTVLPASLTRLPRNRTEGNVPQMAIVTGECDELACLVRSIGLDPSEFTGPTGGGRLHLYQGAGPGPGLAGAGVDPAGDCSTAACPLWSSKASLEKYDLVLLGCECGEHDETKPASAMQAMHDWLGEGGRVLATHYQDTWFKNGPADFQSVATWLPSETDGPAPGPFAINTSAPAGVALHNWLGDLGALDPDGGVPLNAADVSASVSSVPSSTYPWVYAGSASSPVPKALSFLTPIGGMSPAAAAGMAGFCGRATFTDIHAGGGGVPTSASIPASCALDGASAEERTLEFLFFALSGPCALPQPPLKGLPP